MRRFKMGISRQVMTRRLILGHYLGRDLSWRRAREPRCQRQLVVEDGLAGVGRGSCQLDGSCCVECVRLCSSFEEEREIDDDLCFIVLLLLFCYCFCCGMLQGPVCRIDFEKYQKFGKLTKTKQALIAIQMRRPKSFTKATAKKYLFRAKSAKSDSLLIAVAFSRLLWGSQAQYSV